jgi:phosphate acetyltransferase
VLPEGQDERVLAAARRLIDEGSAEPVLLGPRAALQAAAESAGISLDGIHSIDPRDSPLLETYAACYSRRRDLPLGGSRRVVKRPLLFGGMMVACGDAETMVAGVLSPTALVIQAGVLTVGLAEGVSTPSSYFLMTLPELPGRPARRLIYADCGLNVAPTPAQLADVALAAAETARRLLDEEPRVAMLSFSTKGSANHPLVSHVQQALAIARQRAPEAAIDGEFQADAALVPAVAARKVRTESPVAGRANVLVFPDLNSGNIAYKLTQVLAGAQAIGPLLQGFAKPLSDLSRGATVDDILAAARICLRQAGFAV